MPRDESLKKAEPSKLSQGFHQASEQAKSNAPKTGNFGTVQKNTIDQTQEGVNSTQKVVESNLFQN